MVRPLRIEYPGAVYHITARGDRQENIYDTDDDREMFLDILDWTIKRSHWLCYAYCLMSNHYHLLIETPQSNLSYGMRHLNGIYTQRYNRIHNTVGHLFQGRFKSILVEKERYLLELCRYIVLNPVRAKMVKYPWEYKWSSYPGTSGRGPSDPFLSSDWIRSQFGSSRQSAMKGYEAFVLERIEDESLFGGLRGGIILGGEEFTEGIKHFHEEKSSNKEIPRIERYATRPPLSELLFPQINKSDQIDKIYQAYIEYGYTLQEIGDHLRIHYSTVSRMVKRWDQAAKNKT